MLNNYIKIAFRNLFRNKSNTIINIIGLAMGMACCILMSMYIQEELSYDTFHENVNRIAAMGTETTNRKFLAIPNRFAGILEGEAPEVEAVTRLHTTNSAVHLSREKENFIKLNSIRYAEENFFEIFTFPLLFGNEKDALSSPNKIVLTRQVADRLFPESNPVGQSLYWQQAEQEPGLDIPMEVSGVVENPPHNSSVKFEALVSINTNIEGWRLRDGGHSKTFALLTEADAISALNDRLPALVDSHYDESSIEAFFALPLNSFHLAEENPGEGFSGNPQFIYLFGSIALFILIIACVNYMNLATARVSLRSREVGIRKTVGARRGQLAAQFLSESVLLCLIAYILGLYLAMMVLPSFNQLFDTNLLIAWSQSLFIWLGLAAVLTGFIAGVYPALYLSGFSPVSIFRNKLPSGHSETGLRKILVVGQFGIALVLIIGSIVIYKQLNYTLTKDLGFDGDHVVMVELPYLETQQLRETILNDVSGYSGVYHAAMASGAPGTGTLIDARLASEPGTLSTQERSGSEDHIMHSMAAVDFNFLDLLDIKLLAGRNFSRDHISDWERGYILNKNLVEKLGWNVEEAVGKPLFNGEVIGVVDNFHINSLHSELSAVILHLNKGPQRYLLARLDQNNIGETMAYLEQVLAQYAPESPFVYEFLDDKFNAMYQTESKLGQMVGMFTLIAILIACLGLYGLATFSSQQRTKEIGIRKVMGATVASIMTMLTKDFLRLVLIGFAIATPMAWYVMNRWLEDFAYRIEIGPSVFVLAGGFALLIAIATISWQSAKAALMNPADSLRNE